MPPSLKYVVGGAMAVAGFSVAAIAIATPAVFIGFVTAILGISIVVDGLAESREG